MKGPFVVALCAVLFFGPCRAHSDEDGAAEDVARIEHELQTVRHQVDQEFQDHPELSRKDQSLLGKASQLAGHAGAGKVVNKAQVDKSVNGAGEAKKAHVGVAETVAEREISSDVRKFLEQDWAVEAPKDTKMQHGTQFIQEDTAASAGARLLTGLANTESRLARNGIKVVHEVDEIKDGIVDALGESNPRLAANVEKLMDQVRHQEKDVMRAELREAKQDRAEVPKIMFQQRSAMSRHQEGSQTMSAMQRLATSEAKMATKEAHLAHNEAHVVNEIQEAKGAVAAALGKTAPDVAAKVERLMSYAQRAESAVAHNEVHEAQRNLRRARNVEAEVNGQRHHGHYKKAMLIQQKHREGLSQEQRASHTAGMANRELRLAGEDMHILKEMSHLQDAIADALEDEDPRAARHAEHLMNLAQREQKHIFRREFKDAKQDFRKAVSQEKAVKARHPESFAQESSTEASGQAMFSKLAREAHKLRNLAKRKGKIVKEGKHILEETREARAAVRQELGGTAIGHELSQLLKEAQVDEKRAVAASRKGVRLTKREANSAIRLATAMRSD